MAKVCSILFSLSCFVTVYSSTFKLCLTGGYCDGNTNQMSGTYSDPASCLNACVASSPNYHYFDQTNTDECWCGSSCGGFVMNSYTNTYAIDGAICSTNSPSRAPTAAVVNPTMGPTTATTDIPTADPTADPTMGPTTATTDIPTADPTADPTAYPNAKPTTSPTSEPASEEPSAQPTTDPTPATVMNVRQTLYFVSEADYNAQQAAYNQTIQRTVANAMTGVTPDEVTGITVAADASITERPAEVSAVELGYTVLVHDPLLSYSSLRTELMASASTGTMDTDLRHYAAVFGADNLENGTFAQPQVANAGERSESSQLTGVQIAGLVIGVVLSVALLAVVILFVIHNKAGEKSEEAHKTNAV